MFRGRLSSTAVVLCRSIFYRHQRGAVYHTYLCYDRGNDKLNLHYHYQDLAPEGCDEGGLGRTGFDAAASIRRVSRQGLAPSCAPEAGPRPGTSRVGATSPCGERGAEANRGANTRLSVRHDRHSADGGSPKGWIRVTNAQQPVFVSARYRRGRGRLNLKLLKEKALRCSRYQPVE